MSSSGPVEIDRLQHLPLFGDLDHYDLSQLSRWVHEVRAAPGDVLIEQGALPYEMFVVEEGTVVVERDGEPIATLGPGELVGEMALLQQERRIATVRATTPVRAVAIAAEDLDALEAEMPEVLASIRTVMEARRARLSDLDSKEP